MPPRKRTAKSTEPSKSSSSTETCGICCQSLNPKKDEALFCSGSCQQWAHRYCAGVSITAYKVISEKNYPFRCFACHQIAHQDEVTKLQNEVSRLSTLVSDLQSKHERAAIEPVPAAPRSYASAVTTDEHGDRLSIKPTSKVSYESARKFNVVIFGIDECYQGAKRSERLAFDLSKVKSVLVDIDESLDSCSIKDCYRLGRYSEGLAKPRPILVKFVRIEDVSKVLVNRRAAKSPVVVKPDMTKEERVRESALLKQRWNLINSGVPKQAIRISRTKIFVNNVEYGAYSQNGFVCAGDNPVTPAIEMDPPSNLSPQALSKTTSSTTLAVSPAVSTPVTQQPVANESMPHSSPHCLLPNSASSLAPLATVSPKSNSPPSNQ